MVQRGAKVQNSRNVTEESKELAAITVESLCRKKKKKVMEMNPTVATTDNTLPELLYDPITGDLTVDPVVNPAGDSYEKSTLEGLDVTYYPNRALQSIIQRTMELESDSLHGAL